MSHAQSPFAPIQPGPYGNLSSFVMSGMPIGDGDGASTLAFEDAITGETRTRGELRDTALSVALSLRQKYGLREGDRLCLYSPNHVDYPAVMLACGLLGVTLTPANPLYTQEELQRQVDGSGSKIIVSHPLCKPVAELMGKPVVYFGEPSFEDLTKQANLPEAAAAFPEPAAGNDSLCCLPYSSGTTGLPKGTMLSHDNLIANLLQMDACEGPFVDPKADVLMSPLPMFHIYGFLASVLYSVWRGLPVVTMSKFDLEVFCSAVEKRKCTRGHIVPPIILGLAKHPIVSKYDMSSFKVVISAAAPLTADIETECASRLGCIVKQAWGMSELSPIGTFTPDNGLKPGSGTIGVVCGSTEGKIVDIESRETLAVGEEGELMIKGPQVMQGYLDEPEKTAECLTSDGWLATGDIAKMDDEGYFYITDRLKELIKYKGFQVAPAELEGVLCTHPSIADAAVIPVPDEQAGEIPRGYVVMRPDAQETPESIALWINAKVAPHKKMRGGIIVVDEIPKTASGKILRRVVRDMDRQRH